MRNLLIVIPHYNDLEGLQQTLRSVIEETQVDVIVIDDGSKEKPKKSKIKFQGNIFFKFLSTNSGIGIALNRGLEFALEKKYEYIGRLDCGDLCYKNKFTKQLNYLSKNKDIKLLGSWARVIDENGNFKYNLSLDESNTSIGCDIMDGRFIIST